MPASSAIVVNPPNVQTVLVPIEGVTELICHNWNLATIEEVEQKQMGLSSGRKKKPKDPDANYRASLYVIEEDPDDFEGSVFGVPALAFKGAMVRAAKLEGVAMTDARQVFSIEGESSIADPERFFVGHDLIPISGGRPYMRRDVVRVSGKMDLRYRGAFRNWRCVVPISFDADKFDRGLMVNLLNRAGFSVGVGDWRPEKNGTKGKFRVATEA